MLPLFSLWLVNKAAHTTKVNTSESSVLVKALLINILVRDTTHSKEEGVHSLYWKKFLHGRKTAFFGITKVFTSGWSTISLNCFPVLLIPTEACFESSPLALPPPFPASYYYRCLWSNCSISKTAPGKHQMSSLCAYRDSFITYSFCRHPMQYSYFYSPSE